MITIDFNEYKNIIRFSPDFRNEYDHYLMNAVCNKTMKVLASDCFPISFDGEDQGLETLEKMMNTHFKDVVDDFGYKLETIEHSASTLLNVFSDEEHDDEYKDSVSLPMTAFRGRSHETGRLLYKMPENVTVFFNKISGYDQYIKEKNAFETENARLQAQYIEDILKLTGVNKELFDFLTKSIDCSDLEEYIFKTLSILNEYLDVSK